MTAQKIIDAGNQIDGYDVDGMSAPIRFPAYHTQPSRCLGYSELQDGKWTAVDGGGVNGMVCGEPYTPAG